MCFLHGVSCGVKIQSYFETISLSKPQIECHKWNATKTNATKIIATKIIDTNTNATKTNNIRTSPIQNTRASQCKTSVHL